MIELVMTKEDDNDFDAFLLNGIVSYNEIKFIQESGYHPLMISLIDTDTKKKVGGLSAETYYGWMHIKLIYVPETLRGQGFGVQLLQQAEQEARRLACTGIWLDTFSFQAPKFYEAHGFIQLGEIKDYPHGASRCFMEKRF